ncbi:hypothetical protein NDU88_005388 [Pleurodeles waltl]|uniref:Secreted protein n=1 Tax=Pleurodeles waltl TaxID=8319 RepID=A0AAV7LL65_PLEWA|nr:hypothetical protein NDU88_005388 [Pleurodeles waltl]
MLTAILAAAALTTKPPRLHGGPGRTAPVHPEGVRSTAPITGVRRTKPLQSRFSQSGRWLRSKSAPESRAPIEWRAQESASSLRVCVTGPRQLYAAPR